MSNKLSFKLSDLKALLAVFESIAGRSLSTGEFIELLDLMNSFESKEKGGDKDITHRTDKSISDRRGDIYGVVMDSTDVKPSNTQVKGS